MSTILKRLFPVVPVISFLYLMTIATASFAQDLDDVTISGKVTDSNRLPIAGAAVTAMLLTTGVERTVTTNEEDFYRIIEMQPGIYQVKFFYLVLQLVFRLKFVFQIKGCSHPKVLSYFLFVLK